MTPYYQDDWVTIYHGDCRKIIPQLPKVDLVLTDPPYGIGKAKWDALFPKWFVIEVFKYCKTICILPGLWALPDCLEAMGSNYKWIIAGYNKNGMTHGAIGFNNWIPAVCGGIIKRGGARCFFVFHRS